MNIINRKTPDFYNTPNIRGTKNPGRPDITQSAVTLLVDYHSQPLAIEILSCIKDTNYLPNKQSSFKVPDNSFLVSMNVKGLHASFIYT